MIFISYSWKDSSFVQNLMLSLTEQGQQVWIDHKNLNLALPLEPQLAQAIQLADVFLLIDSFSARRSKWVQFERLLATTFHKPTQLIPVPPETPFITPALQLIYEGLK